MERIDYDEIVRRNVIRYTGGAVVCEECGREGPESGAGICGEEVGTPDESYICLDIICAACRAEEYDDGEEYYYGEE